MEQERLRLTSMEVERLRLTSMELERLRLTSMEQAKAAAKRETDSKICQNL